MVFALAHYDELLSFAKTRFRENCNALRRRARHPRGFASRRCGFVIGKLSLFLVTPLVCDGKTPRYVRGIVNSRALALAERQKELLHCI